MIWPAVRSGDGPRRADVGVFGELGDELVRVFRRGVEAPLDEDRFDELARRVFRYQFENNPTYARFCRGRGVDPDGRPHWSEIPPVPTRAFKSLRLVSGLEEEADAVFRTSGTTRGAGERGEHHVLDLSLYRESLVPNFRAHLLPDGARLPLVSLVPSPERVPDSSLSYMVGVVDEVLAGPGGGYFVDPGDGVRAEELRDALSGLEEREAPVLLVGTAFALVHWMDAMDREGWRFRLPSGTRIMETGGFKGRSRTVSRTELYGGLEARLGVPPERIVNEYGMTELLSQFYEPHLGRSSGPAGTRKLVSPPWVRTRVLDPVTLESAPPGEVGLLCHLDLANLGSVSAVLTEDLGTEMDGGFRVLGRARDAEPRGCSLAMDELLSAASGP